MMRWAAPLLGLLCASVAQAQDPVALARRHFRAAEAAEARGELAAAAREYKAAYDAKPHPAVLFNLAGVYERLGDAGEAARYYERYLAEKPDASDAARVRARIADLRGRPSRVTVDSQPPGAHILLDGKPQCDAPCTFSVAGGEHDLDAELTGYERTRKHIRTELGKPLPVAIVMTARSGRLIVRTSPDGAEVALDGVILGTTPLEETVVAGRHQLDVRLYGYRPVRREIALAVGETLALPLDLIALAPPTQPLEIRPPRRLPPPTPDGRPNRPSVSSFHALLGVAGGFNGAHADRSWGGGPLLGLQTPGQAVDLELAVLLPVTSLQFDLRWYLSASSFLRPFLVTGTAVVFEGSDSQAASSSSSSSGTFYTYNIGGGLALDWDRIVLYAQALYNYAFSGSGSRSSVPVLAGMYLRL